MNINPNFPCKLCECPAWAHYASICNVGKPFCVICWDKRSKNIVFGYEPAHIFLGDNLKYLEITRRDKINV